MAKAWTTGSSPRHVWLAHVDTPTIGSLVRLVPSTLEPFGHRTSKQ